MLTNGVLIGQGAFQKRCSTPTISRTECTSQLFAPATPLITIFRRLTNPRARLAGR